MVVVRDVFLLNIGRRNRSRRTCVVLSPGTWVDLAEASASLRPPCGFGHVRLVKTRFSAI